MSKDFDRKCLHISYEGDPLSFWIAENKWKEGEIRWLNEKLLIAERENQQLRKKLYCRLNH